MSSIEKHLELLNRKSKGIDEIHPLMEQPFERQREALLQVEQQVRDLVGPEPLFPRNVEDNAMDLKVLLYKRFFLLGCYPVFDLLRMNDFWTEIHIVFQNFGYIKEHEDLAWEKIH